MIVRPLDDVKTLGSYGEKPGGGGGSARYLLRDDNVGFTLTQTNVSARQAQEMHYRNHVEANLVIDGEGYLTDLATREVYRLRPGSMYTLDKHDRRRLSALSDTRIVCVFTPALVGTETNDADGSYSIL